MSYLRAYTVALFTMTSMYVTGQSMPVPEQQVAAKYPFISTAFNRVQNNTRLDSFYRKLQQLRKTREGQVRIVHIGDSHIQADFLSGVVRKNFQEFGGNAGRGLVFPFQLAQSNAPADIVASSNVKWDFSRIAKPQLAAPCGISGFVLKNTTSRAVVNIALRQTDGAQVFNKIKLFADADSSVQWSVALDNETSIPLAYDSLARLHYPASTVSLVRTGAGSGEFYGVSLEHDTTGIIYHTIGVNGARYDQYNDAYLFWRQLPALNADLYIISLGTNEAQAAVFAPATFINELEIFIGKLRSASPGASVLITTAPDSYKGRTSNKVLRQLNETLRDYCNRQSIPLWDLYRVSNGYGSAYSWVRRGLMSRDRIHFTADGYRLQGTLLYSALAKGYNDYISVFTGN